jgi:hypothetical protein
MISRALLSAGVFAALTSGCGLFGGGGVVVRTPAPYVEVASAPVEVETSPQVVYEGRPTYYYQDHWYYREGPNWRYYREEPSVLIERRQHFHAAPVVRPQPMRHDDDRDRHDRDRDHDRDHH